MRTSSYVVACLFASTKAVQLSHHHNYVQFATGLDGTEQLGETATMNHHAYNYAQGLPECNGGPNNVAGVNCRAGEEKKSLAQNPPCTGATGEWPGKNCNPPVVTTPTNALVDQSYLPLCTRSIHETPGVSCRKPNAVNPGAESQIYKPASTLAQ
jgi:hypothetical protein